MPDDFELTTIPKHIAIIMDGNGRWAEKRKLSRSEGHLAGVKRVEEIVDYAQEIGIKVMTLYTFSTENWRRPQTEISSLMNTITAVLHRKMGKLRRDNMQFRIIGCRHQLPKPVLEAIELTEKETRNNTGIIMNLAFNYGSRMEIIDAFKDLSRKIQAGQLSLNDIDEQTISDALYTRGLPDPDLLIRTSGEQRISNFLLWQLSYSEFYFTDKLWPDFSIDEFRKALLEYQCRERRYGDLQKHLDMR